MLKGSKINTATMSAFLYHSKPDGSVDRNMYFNRMLLESVHASLQDFYSNEFRHS